MIPRCLLLSAMALAVPAHADPRIATHFYQPSEVVTIHGRNDIQSTISFAPEERIENVAVGDSASWQVTPNKRADLLFVKPMSEHARSNMTVVTDQRTYLFDLISAPGAAAVYMLRFTYPDPPPHPAPADLAPPAPVVAEAKAAPPVPDPADLHFAWATRGDKSLLPARLFDDGKSTYLAWSTDAPLPAILVREPGGTEGPVNYTVHGDFVVVEGVPAQIILRSGKQMATLTAASGPDTGPRPPKATPPAAAAINTVSVRPGSAYPIFASRQP